MSEKNRDAKQGRPSLRDFNAYTDRNSQGLGQDNPTDVARPAGLRKQLDSNPGGEAETARLASNQHRRDALEGGSIATADATAAESAPGTVEHLSDASLSPKDKQAGERQGGKG